MKHEKKALLKIAYQRVLAVTLLDISAPLKWIDAYVADNVTGRGTALDEIILSKKDYRSIVVNGRRQSRSLAFKTKLLTKYAPKFTGTDTAVFYDEILVKLGKGKQEFTLHMAVSSVFVFNQDNWQIISLHASLPDPASSSTDTFHVEEANKKLQVLEQMVMEKTAELVAKNRDLAIEAALEKVRARAMSMHKSSELIEVANTMREQLSKLGQHQLEAFVINLYTEGASTHQSWYAFRHSRRNVDHKLVTGIAIQTNDSCKLMQEVVESYFSGEKETLLVVRGKKLADWYKVLSQVIPTIWNEIKKNPYPVNYWNLTSFSGGAMLMVTAEPPTVEAKRIQKRCTEVFDLAFRRFLDLQKAEAQAREAEIELALERVRARTMAMQKSEELKEAATLLYKELSLLNIGNLFNCGYVLVDEKNKLQHAWMTHEDGTIRESHNMPLVGDKIMDERYFHWKRSTSLLKQQAEGKALKSHLAFVAKASKENIDKGASSVKLPDPVFFYCGNFSYGYLHVLSSEELSIDSESILSRFTKVFEQTYTRFLDLQKAEAQAREAKVEASLERVRSHAMGLRKSDELVQIINVIFEELKQLGLDVYETGIYLRKGSSREFSVWAKSVTEDQFFTSFDFPFVDHPILNKVIVNLDKQKSFATFSLEGKDLTTYLDLMFSIEQFKIIQPETKAAYYALDIIHVAQAYFQHGFLEIAGVKPIAEDLIEVAGRFTQVIDLAYTRFLDLQKAEAQAREAQIQLALERVRARTMAMQYSHELAEVSYLLNKQVVELGIPTRGCAFNIYHEHDSTEWFSNLDGTLPAYKTPREKVFLKYYDAGLKGETLFIEEYGKDSIRPHYEYLFSLGYFGKSSEMNETLAKVMPESQVDHVAYFKYGYLLFITLAPAPNAHEIFKRFAKEFEQTYTRFLDLQKAEAQAREAQIEASLEKVRSVAMGMRKAADLLDICETSYAELIKLGFTELRNTMINIHDDSEETFLNYDYSVYAGKAVTKYGYHIHPVIRNLVSKSRAAQDAFVDIGLYGSEFEEWKKFRSKSGEQDDDRLNSINHLNYYFYSIGIGSIGISTFESISEQKLNTLKRFRNVFQLAYQRFTDLTLAEAQAREAQIETALERVRARTMAMQKSEELSAVAHVLFEEFKQLNLSLGDKLSRAFVITVDEEKESFQFFITTSEGNYLPVVYPLPFTEKTNGVPLANCWYSGEAMLINVIEGAAYKQWLKYLDSIQLYISPEIKALKKRVNHYVRFSKGFLGITANDVLEDDAVALLQRFAKVFDQTFTRFVDLQIAEASAKEAIKQAALDRIRANIASMRTVEDLDRITPIIWNELLVLGIPFVRCGIFIMDESKEQIHTFLSSPNGGYIAAYYMRFQETKHIYDMVLHWQKHAKFIERWTLTEFTELATSLYQQGAIKDKEQYLQSIPVDGIWLHFIPFMQGMLYVGNASSLPEEAIDTLAAVADAFSTAYARYEDFNKLEQAKTQVEQTLVDLKQAQKQLVQSEKMASLGELTAGIAHEIQNPLNFVNNFSEVTQELLEELRQELKQGDGEAVQDLMDDIIQNLEKINHHGKRADGIVKGMLQHSRTSTGQKELIDINVLCDEYLRLSYHGLRAKDKRFNAKFETEFDETIAKVNIMPQEMGRVILNLINNAFYAVNKMQQQAAGDYVPTVRLITQKIADKVQISVEDNGLGIPEHIKDKIFQPFFTTKPTGEGTGLGLSLSYDIVKAHSGELSLETELGKGTIFHIVIPA